MDYKKILNGVLSTTLKIDDGKFTELSKNGEEELTEEQIVAKIVDIHGDRIQEVKKESNKDSFQDGYKKAKKEVLTELETEMKEKFDVDSNKTGLELIDEIVEKTSKPSDGTTEDEIRRSKLYLDLESKMKQRVKELEEEKEKAVNEIKSSIESEKTLSQVNQKALNVLRNLKPVLPTNEVVARNQQEAFLDKVSNGYEFQIQDDRIVILDKDGKVLQDKHGNTESFEDFVESKASEFFEFAKNNGGSGSGGSGGEGGSGGKIKTPTNIKELSDIMNDTSIDGAERLKIAEAFEKEHGKN